MIYNDFKGKKLSTLGLGVMRMPVIDGDESRIDEEASFRMIDTAMEEGINYYDTAWFYHIRNSEPFIGRAMAKYPRESFYLGTKFPGYDLENMGKVKEIFEAQLEKCCTSYFDFYFLHNVCEANIDAYLDEEKYHTFSYLLEQKRAGRIRHLGFSSHGGAEAIEQFLQARGEEMEFCMIQLNWLDWEFQDAKAKVEVLNKWNIPIWVMEPVRGGKLAKLAPEHEARLKALRPDEDIPAWAFRFLQSIPGVTVVVSGMSDDEQLENNIRTFEDARPLSDEEMKVLLQIGKEMTEQTSVPCTDCRYCTRYCPLELDIPWLMNLYNEHVFTGEGAFIAPTLLETVENEKKPSACTGCKSCEKICPQQIKISEVMADFAEQLANYQVWG